jgi:hypothetical protein
VARIWVRDCWDLVALVQVCRDHGDPEDQVDRALGIEVLALEDHDQGASIQMAVLQHRFIVVHRLAFVDLQEVQTNKECVAHPHQVCEALHLQG